MAVSFDVVVVSRVALYVHSPRVPIALLRHALGRPVRPDAELRVAEPFGDAVVLHERFPGRLERPARDRASRLRRGASSPRRYLQTGGDGRGSYKVASREKRS